MAGDLKLAYAQFTELESFAKFGTRLDDHTRKIIDHGQRIRAVLKQPELEPAPFREQIVILVALTGGLLDSVPIDKVRDAEQALRKAAADIPTESSSAVFVERQTERRGSQSDPASRHQSGRALPAGTNFQPKGKP